MQQALSPSTNYSMDPMPTKLIVKRNSNSFRLDNLPTVVSRPLRFDVQQTKKIIPFHRNSQGYKKTKEIKRVYNQYQNFNVQQTKSLPKANSRYMQKLIEQSIKQDNRKCQKFGISFKNKYLRNCIFNRMSLTKIMRNPVTVVDQYENFHKQQKNEGISYTSGFIPQISMAFFSVQNAVYFYDIFTLQNEKPQQKFSFKFEKQLDSLFFIQKITLHSSLINTKFTDLLLFAHPFKIELYAYQLKNNTIIIKALNHKIQLECEKPSKFVVSEDFKTLYYLGCDCQVYSISTGEDRWLGIIKRDKKAWKICKAQKSKAKFMGEELKKFMNNALPYIKKKFKETSKGYTSKQQCSGRLLIDHKQKILIAFLNIEEQKGFIFSKTYQKQIINVYSLQNALQPVLSYEITSQNLTSKFYPTQNKYRINDIFSVEASISNDFNCLVYFQKGFRIYLTLNKKKFQIGQILNCPPAEHVLRSFEQCESKPQKLFFQSTHDNEDFSVLTGISNENYLVQFCKYKKNTFNLASQTKQKSIEEMFFIKQIDEIISNASENDIYIYNDLIYSTSIEKKSLLCLQNSSETRKSFIKNEQPKIKYGHQLLRQTFIRPQNFIIFTDHDIITIKILRPIDILFNIITISKAKRNNLMKLVALLMPQYNQKQILIMLIQFYIDKQGIYYYDSQLTKQLQTFVGQQNKSLGKFSAIEDKIQQVQFFYSDLEQSFNYAVLDLMKQIVNSFFDKLDSNKSEKFMFDGIVQYLSRFLRILWYLNIDDLSHDDCKEFIKNLKSHKENYQKLINQIFFKATFEKFLQLFNFLDKITDYLYQIMTITPLATISFNKALSIDPSDLKIQLEKQGYRQELLNRNKTIIKRTSNFDESPLNQYNQIILQIKSPLTKIIDKHYLLEKAKDAIKNIQKRCIDAELGRKNIQVSDIGISLCIQQLVIKEYRQTLFKEIGKKNLFQQNASKQTLQKLENYFYEKNNLKAMIESLQSKKLMTVYCYYFNSTDFQLHLQHTIEQAEKAYRTENIIQRELTKMLKEQIYLFIRAQIKYQAYLSFYNQQYFKIVGYQISKNILSKSENINCQYYWIGTFLIQKGEDPKNIYRCFFDWIMEQKKNQTSLVEQFYFLYLWFCLYLIVKNYYPPGKLQFTITTKKFNFPEDSQTNFIASKLLKLLSEL